MKIKKSEKGVGGTSGTKITLSSHWVEKHPEDLGLVVHELTHVIQGYPSGKPWWITEGIADYIRWAIYKGKGQHWFPKPRDPEGYKQGYRVTAGFLLWLEAERAPGIVKKLNSAMRDASYSAKLFEQESGRSLDELWSEYVELWMAGFKKERMTKRHVVALLAFPTLLLARGGAKSVMWARNRASRMSSL